MEPSGGLQVDGEWYEPSLHVAFQIMATPAVDPAGDPGSASGSWSWGLVVSQCTTRRAASWRAQEVDLRDLFAGDEVGLQ